MGRFQNIFHKHHRDNDLKSVDIRLTQPLCRQSNRFQIAYCCVSRRNRAFQARETQATIAVADATSGRQSVLGELSRNQGKVKHESGESNEYEATADPLS
jgi:hypothetical protein